MLLLPLLSAASSLDDEFCLVGRIAAVSEERRATAEAEATAQHTEEEGATAEVETALLGLALPCRRANSGGAAAVAAALTAAAAAAAAAAAYDDDAADFCCSKLRSKASNCRKSRCTKGERMISRQVGRRAGSMESISRINSTISGPRLYCL